MLASSCMENDWEKKWDTYKFHILLVISIFIMSRIFQQWYCCQNVAEKFQVTREEQDKFALKSQEKCLKAQKNNKFNEEIINLKIMSKKTEIDFNKDEHPREGINLDTLSRLKTIFNYDEILI